MTRYGVCKECNNDAIPLNDTTKIQGPGIDIWECPTCGYPHDINDFMAVVDF